MSRIRNTGIRNEIKAANVPHWVVAEAMRLTPPSFSTMLRHELPPERVEEVRAAIEKAKLEWR